MTDCDTVFCELNWEKRQFERRSKAMSMRKYVIGCLGVLGLTSSIAAVTGTGSALEQAVADGGHHLGSGELAQQFIGKTGIWVSPAGDKKIAIYYGTNNDLHGQMVGGEWSGRGYYAVANTDKICISWNGSDKGRLRCLDVVVVGDVVTKFNADGSLNGVYEGFEKGKTF
jgi:hypothetical protein